MKRSIRIVAFVAIACLLISALFVSAFALSTRLDFGFDGVYADTKHDFEAYSAGSTYFDSNTTIKPAGGNIWPNSSFNGDTDIVVKEETVNGVSNKYVEIKAKDGFSSMLDGQSSACWTFNKSRTIKDASYDREYLVVEFDIRATQYVTTDANGVKHLYDSLDEITDETERASAKLSYPEGLYFYTPVSGKYADGTSQGIQRYFYIVSVDNEWYLTTNDAYNVNVSYKVNEACKLPGDIGEWNHITFVQRFTGSNSGYADGISVYAYINGNYAGKASSGGYQKSVTSSFSYTMRMHIMKNVVTVSEPSYCFNLDNITATLYEKSYEPTVENSFTEAFRGTVDTTKSLVEYGDLIYNYDYVSPHGTSYALKWTDLNGKIIGGERISIGNTPTMNSDRLLLGDFSGILGDYSKLSAWEWNVSEDPTVFTPVTALTGDMIGILKAREGDKTLTVRPAVVDAICVDGEGNILASEKYFAGNEVASLAVESNGWYSVSYSLLSNSTVGAASDSFVLLQGVENVFLADIENTDIIAAIEGVKYNMSLLTNYYMNIYVPQDAPEGVTPLGFYAEEALINKYSEGSRKVSVGGVIYEENSFGIRNSDIAFNAPRYYGIEVNIGGVSRKIAYKIDVDLIGYVRGVLSVYSCGSYEASLAVSLLNYAAEAYKLAGSEEHSDAKVVLSAHTDCGCYAPYNALNDYKGDVSTLLDYAVGAAYDVTSAAPSLLIYVKADATDVASVKVAYKGALGPVEAELVPLSAITVNGVSVIPYAYREISASDVKEIMEISILGADGEVLASGTYGLSNYVFNNSIAVANALYSFSAAAADYKKSVSGETPAIDVMGGITVSKSSSLRPAITVNPGDEITYTFSITNNNSYAITVPVTDKIPANTTLKRGAVKLSGFDVSFEVELSAGETKSVAYTVSVDSDKRLRGAVITPPTALVGGNEAGADANYVGLTLNAIDAVYMAKGIDAISYSEHIDSITLIKMMYTVAFSKSFTATETPANIISAIYEKSSTDVGVRYRNMLVPTLWGGSSVGANLLSDFHAESAHVSSADLISGDILVVKDSAGSRIYIYDGEKLASMTNGYAECDTEAVIDAANAANYYATLRPSLVMTTRVPMTEDPLEAEDLNEYQNAIVKTAKAYVQRGYRLQYDDGTLADNSEYRWQIGKYQPEDYTEQKWGYINCAAFTYDVYRTALGYDLGSRYTTASLMRYFTNGGAENDNYPFYYEWNAETSADPAKQAAVEKKFFDTLQVGDLVVVTRGTKTGGYGHVMLYVGDGMLVHSSGSTRSGDTEYYEASIRYMNAWSYLFDPTASNYLFIDTPGEKTVYQTCIVRPLAEFSGSIPENTLNRVANLEDIMSEKLSSHAEGMTVNKGEYITYTFKLKNLGKTDKTLEVRDVVPENSVLVSADGAALNGNALVWSVNVPAGKTALVSYVVEATGEYGSYIESTNATVGGVSHGCPKVYIEKTLTASEQQALLDAIDYYRSNNTDSLTGTALLNAIYVKAGLEAPFVDGDGNEVALSDVRNSIMIKSTVKTSMWTLNTESPFYDMAIPTLYGGAKYYTKNYYSATNKTSSDRSRLPREQAVCVGDIIVARFSDKNDGTASYATYIYVGDDHFVNVNASLSVDSNYESYHRLQRMLSVGNYYVILRPSMAFAD